MEAQISDTSDTTAKKSICDQLLELAEIIYTTEKTACNFERNYSSSISNLESSFYCGQDVKRILDSIKRCVDNEIEIKQYNDIQRRAIMKAITRQYSCDDVKDKVEGEIKLIRKCTVDDVPEVVNALKILRENLKKDRKEKDKKEPKKDKYFEEQCKELVEFKEVPSNGSNERKYTILLHSGFQKRVFNFRPGPSPISSDTDGVFICRLRKAIIKFLDDYKIKYEKSDRFDNFDEACNAFTGSATDLQPSSQESTNEATGFATDLQPSSQYSTYGSTGSATNLQPSSQYSTYGSTGSATNLQPSSQYSTYGSTRPATDLQPSSQESTNEATGFATDLQPSSQSSHNHDNADTVLPKARQQGSLMLTGPDYDEYLDLSKKATASLAIGGRLSRRRKAYKTTRRNNKYKNKKHYIKKRHTKRCKKSHRRRISRR